MGKTGLREMEGVQRKDAFYVPLNLIVNSSIFERTYNDETILDLVEDIRENGQIEPCVIIPAKEAGKYELIAGHRRFRAITRLTAEGTWTSGLYCVLNSKLASENDLNKLCAILSANFSEEMSIRDIGRACSILKTGGFTLAQIESKTGVKAAKAAESIALYLGASPELLEAVDSKKIPAKAAKEIIKKTKNPAEQKEKMERVKKEYSHSKPGVAPRVQKSNAPLKCMPREKIEEQLALAERLGDKKMVQAFNIVLFKEPPLDKDFVDSAIDKVGRTLASMRFGQ
jgi:ParB-like chromosome segregation protein Spo0J